MPTYLISENQQPFEVCQLKQPLSVGVLCDLNSGGDGFKQLDQLGEPVVGHPVTFGKETKLFTQHVMETGEQAVEGLEMYSTIFCK